MLSGIFMLGQGSPGALLIDIVAKAGIVIVPILAGVWVLWASKGRPKSNCVVAGPLAASFVFFIWIVAFVAYCTTPSRDSTP